MERWRSGKARHAKRRSAVCNRPGIEDGARPILRPLLRQIMTGRAKYPVLMHTAELPGMVRGTGIHPVRIAIYRDCRNVDRRLRAQPGFDERIGRISRYKPEAMPIGMDHYLD